MLIPFFECRLVLNLLLALALTIGWVHAAPYGPNGMEIEWTQPDGSKISLRVFGDEFYSRTETPDGYTVVYHPADKAYHFARLSNDGQRLIPSGRRVNGRPPAGLAKHLEISPEARRIVWKERYEKLAPNERTNWSKRVQAARQRKGLDAQVPAAEPTAGDGGTNRTSSAAFAPVTGSYVGLTILVQFPDDPDTGPSDPTNFPTTKVSMENYCNQIGYTGGGNSGSIRDYFLAQSLNQTDYTQVVTEIVTLPQPRAYYNWSDYPDNETLRDGGLTGRLVLNDAITILKAEGFDFTGLTRDGSNRVVATNVLFAGATSGVWPDGLWPHRWNLSPQVNVGTTPNPIYIDDYQITNAQTASVPIGTFCHENGHLLLKYPDLYDYGGESRGVGNHCLMGGGNYNNGGRTPSPINGYFKDVSGWSNVVDITTSQFFTDALPTTNNEGYRIRKPGTTTEYFLIENRGTGDPWAQYSPDKGIMIWHIDETVNGNDDEQMTASQHYEVSVEQADGAFDLENNRDGGDTADAFDSTFPNFTDSTAPNAKWWSGSNSGIQIAVLSAAGASMNVRFGLPANTVSVLAPNGGEQIYFGSSQTITWGGNITGNVNIELFKGGILHSELSANESNDGSYSWLVSSGLPAGNDYTVKISSVDNPAYMDSSDAEFTIMAQPTLADALETTGLTWSNSGNGNWFAQSTTTHDGIDAAQSGTIGHNQNSYMETTLTGPGNLTFWWKVSSETNYDYLRFYLDGAEQTGSLARISGTVGWTQKTVTIPSGIHTVKWGYTKDGSVVSNADAAWVDQFIYTPSAAPEIVVEEPVGTNLIDGSASIDCGVFNHSSSSAPITFTVKNTGAADLTGLSLSKDGFNSAEFTLGSLGATTLAPGASTTFTVTFSPDDDGARTAAIHIASNDSDENPFDITLTGTGVTEGTLVVTPAVDLTSSGTYSGLFSPSSQQYTLRNAGTDPIDWTAAKTADWVDLSTTDGTLGPGDVAMITASINGNATSLALGGYNDTVTFTNTTNNHGDTTRGISLTVNPIPATVTLGNLSQTYDGFQKFASVTTDPPDLDHTIIYDGSATPPTSAGTYNVVATITEPNYTGGDSKDLIIAKASQTIDFAAPAPAYDNAAPFALTATATSGLTVSFASSNTSVATVSGATVTVIGLGTTTITASQAGNTNYNAATSVPQTLSVVRANPLAVTSGPYSILAGQTLTLDGSASQPSYGETITTYEWDLNNDNNFGDVTGATPAAISYNDLTTTWGRVFGANTIQLKVTDSSLKTSIISSTLTIIATLTWDANDVAEGQANGAGEWLGSNLWWSGTTNLNWVSGSNAVFGGPSTAGDSVTLASPTTVNFLTFDTFTGTYTLGTVGNMITLNGGIAKNPESGSVTIVSPITLDGSQTWTNNSTDVLNTGNGNNLINNAGFDLTVDGTGTTNFGVIYNAATALAGSGDLVKNGSGRLNAGGLNSGFSGAVTINGGVLQAYNDGGALGNGNLTLTGGVLSFYWGTAYSRPLGPGTGEVQILGGESGFAGAETTGPSVSLGITVVWGALGQGSATGYFNPGKLLLGDSGTNNAGVTTFTSGINLNGVTRTIAVPKGLSAAGNVSTISGAISNSMGTAGLIKEGDGILILSNASSAWNGSTTISEGVLNFTGNTLASVGGGSGRNITLAAGTGVRFNSISNTLLNRLVETASEITVMTGSTTNNFDFSSSSGANLPHAFLGNWASNGAKCEISGTFTPADDAYRLGGKSSSGLLAIVGTNKLTGTRGLIVGGTGASGIRVMLAGDNDFTGDTVINTGTKLSLGNNLAMQNSAFDLGVAGGTFALNSAGTVTNAAVAASPTFGGLKGSRNLLSAFTSAGGNNESNLAAASVTGFTLNVGTGNTCTYTGAIADFATGTTLTKTGAGIQIFSTANTYTGETVVNQGTLLVNNATGSGTGTNAVSVNGGTLGGSGTISGAITVEAAGNLSPGNASAGTLNIGGGLDLAAMAGGTGIITYELNDLAGTSDSIAVSSTLNIGAGALGFNNFDFINLGGLQLGNYSLITSGGISGTLDAANLSGSIGAFVGTLSIAGNNLVLNISPPDTTPPSLTSITDDQSGGLISANTLVTYTVTFSEDINDTTVTSADFGNAGTSAVTISLVSEISPGVFTVEATPTTAGTLLFQINAAAELQDIAGNDLDTTSAITDDTTLTVDDTAPTVVSISDDKNGGPVSLNTLVTYTVTFSEDMNDATVTSADFGNAGTSAVTIGSVSEISPGVFTVEATPTTAGTLLFQINAGAELQDLAGNDLDTASAITDDNTLTVDDTVPTVVSITDDKSGGPVSANTLVTYTVTFSEDMDAASVTSADFGNASTSAVTIGLVSETSPGVFTIEATPTTAGTLLFQINADAILKDAAGNNLNTSAAITDDTSITVNSADPYATWSGGAPFDADANGDDVENGLAWLLGAANPIANATNLLPIVTQSGGNLILTFSCLNAANRGTAMLNIQHSSDLGITDPWTAVPVPEGNAGPTNGVTFTVSPSGNLNNITATISSSEEASGRLYGRLKGQP
jgi:M6 family metalloprotease-like protein